MLYSSAIPATRQVFGFHIIPAVTGVGDLQLASGKEGS